MQELLKAKRDLALKGLLKQLSRWEGLLIDDLGYVQQSREEMEVLFTLLAERYERGSVLVTSNLAFSQWEQIFKDPMTTAAAIDRLVHHSVIVELNVPSYRAEAAKKAKEPPESRPRENRARNIKGLALNDRPREITRFGQGRPSRSAVGGCLRSARLRSGRWLLRNHRPSLRLAALRQPPTAEGLPPI